MEGGGALKGRRYPDAVCYVTARGVKVTMCHSRVSAVVRWHKPGPLLRVMCRLARDLWSSVSVRCPVSALWSLVSSLLSLVSSLCGLSGPCSMSSVAEVYGLWTWSLIRFLIVGLPPLFPGQR